MQGVPKFPEGPLPARQTHRRIQYFVVGRSWPGPKQWQENRQLDIVKAHGLEKEPSLLHQVNHLIGRIHHEVLPRWKQRLRISLQREGMKRPFQIATSSHRSPLFAR